MSKKYSGMGGDPNTHHHYMIAFVIDNEVVSVLNTDERTAAIFLSNPTIIDVSENFRNGQNIVEGDIFDGRDFHAIWENE